MSPLNEPYFVVHIMLIMHKLYCIKFAEEISKEVSSLLTEFYGLLVLFPSTFFNRGE